MQRAFSFSFTFNLMKKNQGFTGIPSPALVDFLYFLMTFPLMIGCFRQIHLVRVAWYSSFLPLPGHGGAAAV